MSNSESILKSIYCNYRGRVTIYDVHSKKVQGLSGQLTYEKYLEIERRSDSAITEIDGLEDYIRIIGELKTAFILQDAAILIVNNTDNVEEAIFFGANEHILSGDKNYGNKPCLEVVETSYLKLLQQLLEKPINAEKLRVNSENISLAGFNIKIGNYVGKGVTQTLLINVSNYISNMAETTQIVDMPAVMIDAHKTYSLPIRPKERIAMTCKD